jgi:hypothetical protein
MTGEIKDIAKEKKMIRMEAAEYIHRSMCIKQQHKDSAPMKKQNLVSWLVGRDSFPGVLLFFLFVVLSMLLFFKGLLR